MEKLRTGEYEDRLSQIATELVWWRSEDEASRVRVRHLGDENIEMQHV